MSKASHRLVHNEFQKEFVKLFDSITVVHSRWSVWTDFVMMIASEISFAVDISTRDERFKDYLTIKSKYNEREQDTIAKMFACVVDGMDADADQDFLGELYMMLGLGNDQKGQFFTPYNVCKAMSKMCNDEIKERIEQEHWISVNDCACGAGATLIAFANECRDYGINYQKSVLFVAQDIDYVTGLMCYIQLSLMGCAGYVVIANTLTHPAQCVDQKGLIPKSGQQVWYMPMYFHSIWHWRRVFSSVDTLMRPLSNENTPVHKSSQGDKEKAQEGSRQAVQVKVNTDHNGQLTLI